MHIYTDCVLVIQPAGIAPTARGLQAAGADHNVLPGALRPACDGHSSNQNKNSGRIAALVSDTVRECRRRAKEARHMADTATSLFERADFLDIEQRWLSLARSPQLWARRDEPKQQSKPRKNSA